MALVLKDRVQETSTTTGTSTFSLAGAVTEFQTFSSAIGNGNTTYYAAYLSGGNEWEVGIGTVGAGTLSRDTILDSSNSGNIVTFSAGTKYVFCTYPAGKSVYLDASGSISEPIVNISGITGAISTVDTITFDTGYTTALTAGQLGWDGNNTLGIGMAGGNVTQHIGEDQFFYCKATSTITKGQVIMFTGAVGASGVPTGAPATGITDGTYIMGIAAENIANNGFGLVQAFGTLRNINTSGYADGDILWYDPSVTGGLTKTKPSAPNVKVQMAAVINGGSSGGGTILIRIDPGSTLGGTDSNAQITSPTGGQTIIYDSVDGYWKNASLSAGTAISVTNGASGSITIANTGVTQATAGTGISVSSGTGNVTITNTAPDQIVSITGTGGATVTGTYPNFTIDTPSGTVTSVGATGGTGISVSGSPITGSGSFTITNTAPDQVVSIAAGTNISVTGTYPSFTIANTAPTSGGTVTSVNATVPSIFSVSGVPITGSGTIAMTYSGTALPIANGGTNATATPTNGGVAYGTGTAYAFTGAGTSGQVLTSNGASAPTWQTPSGGSSIDVQTFTSNGTWTKPSCVTLVKVCVWGGGGGGGGGSRRGGNCCVSGGGGGGGGARNSVTFYAACLPATASITIGAGGTGGTGTTGATGNAGTAGGTSQFSTLVYAYGGGRGGPGGQTCSYPNSKFVVGGGGGGTGSVGTNGTFGQTSPGGKPRGGCAFGTNTNRCSVGGGGGAGAYTAGGGNAGSGGSAEWGGGGGGGQGDCNNGSAGGSSLYGAGGGGSGHFIQNNNTGGNNGGGSGGTVGSYCAGGGGTGGTTGNAGTAGTQSKFKSGTGGGGGGLYSNGGAGGSYGGGGGGGGAATSTTTGGNGGAGGGGAVIVTSW